MKDLQRRARLAAARYLEHRGFDVLDVDWRFGGRSIDIVAREGETLVFAAVEVREAAEAGFPPSLNDEAQRAEREAAAIAYLASARPDDGPVRFDDVGVVAFAPDRAFIRHQRDSLGEAAEPGSERALAGVA